MFPNLLPLSPPSHFHLIPFASLNLLHVPCPSFPQSFVWHHQAGLPVQIFCMLSRTTIVFSAAARHLTSGWFSNLEMPWRRHPKWFHRQHLKYKWQGKLHHNVFLGQVPVTRQYQCYEHLWTVTLTWTSKTPRRLTRMTTFWKFLRPFASFCQVECWDCLQNIVIRTKNRNS